jgi:hypothetical protein
MAVAERDAPEQLNHLSGTRIVELLEYRTDFASLKRWPQVIDQDGMQVFPTTQHELP